MSSTVPISITAVCLALSLTASMHEKCRARMRIADVPDYQQGDFAGSNDCAPTAAANVLGYWDANGYENFIDGSSSYQLNPAGVTALVDLLKLKMQWHPDTGTSVGYIDDGIAGVAAQKRYPFTVYNDHRVFWLDVKTEVNASHPCVLTVHHPVYQTHSMACIGYDEVDATRVVIVHDNWASTAIDVYLNYDEMSDRSLTVVIPPTAFIELVVHSAPFGDLPISVTPPDQSSQSDGKTSFTRKYDPGTNVWLTAPSRFNNGTVDSVFAYWIVSDTKQIEGLSSISVRLSANTTVTAVYNVGQRTLSVESKPCEDVLIAGDLLRRTSFSYMCNDGDVISISAPTTTLFINDEYRFIRWVLDGVVRPHGEETLSITVSEDHTAVAVYQLAGDSNGDCVVNLLDLITVRQHLGAAASGQFLELDVNRDGVVGILDLIFVRNRLGSSCR